MAKRSSLKFDSFYEGQASLSQLYDQLTSRRYPFWGLYNIARGEKSRPRWCDALFVGKTDAGA